MPELAARAGEGDRLRTMPPDLVVRLREAGLFRMAVPRSLGGHQLDPASVVTLAEQLSWADGSAGWTVLIGNAAAFFAWLDPAVTAPLLGDAPEVVSTGVWAPLGRAERAGGGRLRITGRWPFNSGCRHADWFQVGVVVMDGDRPAVRADGSPDRRVAFLPAGAGEVLDTWHAWGLRGTGSHDVAVDGLILPDEQTASLALDPPRHRGRLLELGFDGLTAAILAGFPLGVARRALDELIALAPAKRRGAEAQVVAADHHAQMRLGQAEGVLGSARAFVLDAVSDAWRSIGHDGACSAEQRRRIGLAARHAMRAAVAAVELTSDLAGAAVAYEDHPIGRCVRDLAVARQHVMFSGDGFAEYARSRFDATARGRVEDGEI